MSLQMGTSSPTLNHMMKGTTSSKKKLTDEVRPPKKLRSRKHIVEALENQEFSRPFVSGKAFNRKSRLLDFVENQEYIENVRILVPCVHSLKDTGDKDGKLSDFEFLIVEVLENPLIFIHDKKISDLNSLVRILEFALKRRGPLLIVAEDVESDALAMLILNKHHAGIKLLVLGIIEEPTWRSSSSYWRRGY